MWADKQRWEESYILVLAVPTVRMLEPGSQALRRPLPLDTLPEEMARLWRVGEGVVCVDLAGESLIQWRHFGYLSTIKEKRKSNKLAKRARKKSKLEEVSGWCDSIGRCSGGGWKGKITPELVFRIHITYFQPRCSDPTDASATRFQHFPNLMRDGRKETNERWLQETK